MRSEVERSLVYLEPTEDGMCAVYSFAPDLPVFAGHFPGNPLVPGAYLIEGLRDAVSRTLDRKIWIEEICDARFTAPAAPGQPVRFEIVLEPGNDGDDGASWIAKAHLECAGQAAARLRLRLRAASR